MHLTIRILTVTYHLVHNLNPRHTHCYFYNFRLDLSHYSKIFQLEITEHHSLLYQTSKVPCDFYHNLVFNEPEPQKLLYLKTLNSSDITTMKILFLLSTFGSVVRVVKGHLYYCIPNFSSGSKETDTFLIIQFITLCLILSSIRYKVVRSIFSHF